jgi:TonB family protein
MHLGPLLKSSLLAAMTLAFATSTSGQSTAPSGMQRVPPGTPPDRPAIRALKQIGKVEVLGDTFGVDLDSYLRTGVLPYLRGAWHNYAPRGLSTTTDKSGIAVIEFDILQGGSLANISVVSTSGVNDIDTDAISAITKSSPYEALPSEFPGQYLRLRCQLFYNPGRFIHLEIIGANHNPARSLASATNNETGYADANGTTLPRAVYQPSPQFTDKARKAKINGVVLLKVTVTASGDVGNIKVAKGLGYGLDEKAEEAVRTWKFKPATKDGVPVDYELAVEVDFRLY